MSSCCGGCWLWAGESIVSPLLSYLCSFRFHFVLCFGCRFPLVVLCFVYIRNLHASRFCRLAPNGYILLWTGVSCAVVQFSGLIILAGVLTYHTAGYVSLYVGCLGFFLARVNTCHVAICSAYVVVLHDFFRCTGICIYFLAYVIWSV